MHFSSTILLLASVVGSALCVSVADIKEDIAAISTKADIVHTAVNEFNRPGLVLAHAIQNNGTEMLNAIQMIINDTKTITPNDVSEDDQKAILCAIQKLEPTFLDIVSGVTIRRPIVEGFPSEVGARELILQDMLLLRSTVIEFGKTLTTITPAVRLELTAIGKNVVDAIAPAIIAYLS